MPSHGTACLLATRDISVWHANCHFNDFENLLHNTKRWGKVLGKIILLPKATMQKFSKMTGISVVVANMIGTGVFTSLGFQLLGIQSYFALMMLWLIGGLTALCGALTYAELGVNLPRSGGEYNFLGRLYHPCAGFISGWVSATVGFAAPVALAAMTFGAYLSAVFPELPRTGSAVVLVILLMHQK